MGELQLPWLQLSIFTPVVGAIIVWRMKNRLLAQKVAILCSLLSMCFGIAEWFDFSKLEVFEAEDRWGLLGTGQFHGLFVVDQFSTPLVPLTSLLYLTTILTTLRTKINRFSFGWTLFSQGVVVATFATQQPWLIIVMLCLSVLQPYLELKKRNQSTRVFSIYMGSMIFLLLFGQTLLTIGGENRITTMVGGFCITVASLLRAGIFPLHGWISDLFHKATFGTALLFVTPLTGAYAVMRLVFPLAPNDALQTIALLSLFTAVYAAGLAIVQNDSRRFFCNIFISHSSLVLIGLEIATPISLTGALCVWTAIGISMHGFGLALRCIEARVGRLSLKVFHGLYEHTPFLAGMFLLTGLASIGFPGTVGFIGTELLVESAVGIYPLIGFAVVIATAINGIAVVKAYFHVFTGTEHQASISMSCRPQERATILIIVLLNIFGGFAPQVGVTACYRAAVELLEHRDSGSQAPPENRHVADDQQPAITLENEQERSVHD